jgi:hypothetical protein
VWSDLVFSLAKGELVIYKWDFALWQVEKAWLEFGGLERAFVEIRGGFESVAEEFGERAGAWARLCLRLCWTGWGAGLELFRETTRWAWVRLVVGDFEGLGVAAIV